MIVEVKELEQILLPHCINMTILKTHAADKKKKSILDSIIMALIRADLSIEELSLCIEEIKEDKVFDISFFKKGGNVYDYINKKWHRFAKELWSQRSVGLGSPNAASGEGELMCLFLSPKILKPVKGDLMIDGEIIEVKGEKIRINASVTGKEFLKKTLKLCREYDLQPNKSFKNNFDAVELEKYQHFNHWKKQLARLNIEKQQEFIKKWLYCLDDKEHEVSNIFKKGKFSYKELVKEIVISMYRDMLEKENFKRFLILGNGSNVKVLGTLKDFKRKIERYTVKIKSDYVRLNQNAVIAWYVE